MIKNSNSTKTCIYCGKVRTVTVWNDDGMDWCGHARGIQGSGIDDSGCDCKFGKIEYEKTSIKPMCCNCLFEKSGYCTNEEELKQVSDLFDVGDKLQIKNQSKKCGFYELDAKIIYRLLK